MGQEDYLDMLSDILWLARVDRVVHIRLVYRHEIFNSSDSVYIHIHTYCAIGQIYLYFDDIFFYILFRYPIYTYPHASYTYNINLKNYQEQ